MGQDGSFRKKKQIGIISPEKFCNMMAVIGDNKITVYETIYFCPA